MEPLTEAITEHLGGWMPESHTEAEEFFQNGLPSVFEALGEALARLSQTLPGEKPLDNSLTETLGEMGSTIGGFADVAREMHPLYRSAHETEINRLENPRPGEEMWDVRNQ